MPSDIVKEAAEKERKAEAMQRFIDMERGKNEKRPEIMPRVLPIYEYECSEIPEKIRVSFADGQTAVYELRTEQPAPVIMENIRIIRKWKTGYQAPRRGRR
jgi:hypothetical protein